MGIFNPFSYWPLAPSKDNNGADDTAETTKYQPGNSWAIVNCDQTTSNVNSTSIASPDTTPSPTELAAASKEKPDHDEPGPEHRTGNRFSLRPKLSLDTTVGRPVRRHAEQQRPVGVIGSRHAAEAAPAGGARSSKQSWRGSKRLNGLKTILRVRKGQEQLKQQFNAESSSMGFFGQGPGDPAHGDLGRDPGVEDHGDQDQDQDVCNSATKESQYGDPLEVPETSEIPPVPSIPPMLPNSSISPIPPIPPIPQLLQLPHLPQLPEMNRLYDYGEDNDTRRVSDRSAQSKDSNATSSTVLHRASVCPVDQVPLTDRGYRYENPFEELHELCGTDPCSHSIALLGL